MYPNSNSSYPPKNPPMYAPAQCSMSLHPNIFSNVNRAPEQCPYPNGDCICAPSSQLGYTTNGYQDYGVQNVPYYQYSEQNPTPANTSISNSHQSSTRTNSPTYRSVNAQQHIPSYLLGYSPTNDVHNEPLQGAFQPARMVESPSLYDTPPRYNAPQALDTLLAAINMLLTTGEKLLGSSLSRVLPCSSSPTLASNEELHNCTQKLEALQLNNVSAPPTIVFIYDIEDITQLSWQNIEKVGREFPDLVEGSAALQDLLDYLAQMFNWGDKNNRTVMNIKEAVLDDAIHDYYELKERCEIGGPIISYKLLEKFGMSNQHFQLSHAAKQFQSMFRKPLRSAKKCLKAISNKSLKRTYQNVVLSENDIGYQIAQLLLSGRTAQIPLENLYSIFRKSKEHVLERIQQDYGDDCLFIVVTSNRETLLAAEKLKMPVWPVEYEDSFDNLYTVQLTYLLK